MRSDRVRFLICTVAAAAFAAGAATAQPDVIVGDLTGPSNYTSSGGIDAFSIGTTSCNIGTSGLTWIASTNQHPVIGQNLYRLYEGRFLHVGQAWLKHGFAALAQNLCSPCNNPGTQTILGVGCSDPYGSGLNGQQSGLGPKFEVNASTGFFPYPYTSPPFSGSIARRLQVPHAMLNVTGAQWIAEAQYIQPEDATAGNGDNNASHRMATISGGATEFTLGLTGSTVRELPAITAWPVLDPGVSLQTAQVPGVDGGVFYVGAKRTQNANGTWHFEYTVFNLNCHDSAASLSFTFPSGVTISNTGFHSPGYHSGEPFNNNPWTASTAANGVTFAVDQPFASNPNSNALRWGTAYSFWFDSTEKDPTGTTIGLYRNGGTSVLPAPSFPVPQWQVNQAGASLDVNGLTNDGFIGPIEADLSLGENFTLNLDGTAGMPYVVAGTIVDGVPGYFITANDQVVNLDLSDASFGPILSGTMPAGGLSLPITAPSVTFDVSVQMVVFDGAAADGFWLSALNEIKVRPEPRVLVEAVGPDSFNNSVSSGFWKVTSTGVTAAAITSVTFDFSTATGPAAGLVFDTDQNQMNGLFFQGTTYRNGSAAACGLDFTVSSPYPGSGWIGTNSSSGAVFQTVQFQFTGNLFNNLTFEFDADTDPGGPHSGGDHAGLPVSVSLSDGSMLSGQLAADPNDPDRAFLELF